MRTTRHYSITARLFVYVFATMSLIVAAMSISTQWSFSRGFIGYLNEQSLPALDALVPRLQRAYASHAESWQFLRDNPHLWSAAIEPVALGSESSAQHADQGLMLAHQLGIGQRLTLYDANHDRVAGFPDSTGTPFQRPIIVEGRTAGWIAMTPIEDVTDGAELRFQHDRLKATVGIALLALTLAGAIAWWLARTLLAPIRDVASATHSLASGRYETRVSTDSAGEAGQLCRDFNLLASRLERNEALRRDYMADISHELRTPLSVLRGEIEAIEDGIHKPDQERIALLRDEVMSLTRLVEDLHALALADVGALRYSMSETDVVPLVQQEASRFATRCSSHQLQLHVKNGASEAITKAAPDRIRQVIHNLMENSIRHTDAGGMICINTQTTGAAVQITIEDTKPGVPEAALPHLFERFYREERSCSRATGGSGLGLAICRSILQAHGGDIHAEASPLGGLRMTLWLPLIQDA